MCKNFRETNWTATTYRWHQSIDISAVGVAISHDKATDVNVLRVMMVRVEWSTEYSLCPRKRVARKPYLSHKHASRTGGVCCGAVLRWRVLLLHRLSSLNWLQANQQLMATWFFSRVTLTWFWGKEQKKKLQQVAYIFPKVLERCVWCARWMGYFHILWWHGLF